MVEIFDNGFRKRLGTEGAWDFLGWGKVFDCWGKFFLYAELMLAMWTIENSSDESTRRRDLIDKNMCLTKIWPNLAQHVQDL